MAGVSPQDYEVYIKYMQSQQAAPPVQNGMAKGGLVSQVNPFYTYSQGLRNIHKLDDSPSIQNGVLPAAPPLGQPLQPVGLDTLIPQQPGNYIQPKQYASGGIVSLSPLQQRMAYAMRYYTGMGYSPAQAAGIVGNLVGESNLNPTIVGDKGAAYGIGQYHSDRLNALKNFAGDRYNTLDAQLSFVPHELAGSEAAAGRRLANANDVASATQAMIGYERPRGWTADNPTAGDNYAGRLRYANQAYSLYTGNPAAVASVQNPAMPAANPTAASVLPTTVAVNAAAPQTGLFDVPQQAAATMVDVPVDTFAADAAADADPFGGLLGLMALSQQPAPAPVGGGAVRKAQPTDPNYTTAVTSQTPDAYAAYLQRRRMMMGA